MAFYPSGVVVEIVGIEESSHGKSCEEHTVCGAVLQLDAVICLCVADPKATSKGHLLMDQGMVLALIKGKIFGVCFLKRLRIVLPSLDLR
jgi:hypothetical protein